MRNKRTVLWIALMVMALLLQGCSKKTGAQESSNKGNTATKAVEYAKESDFEIDWDPNVKGGVIIKKYDGVKYELNIPPTIQNNPVTRIGQGAFVANSYMNILTIPNGVTSIEEDAFSGCTKLKSVTIPDSIKSIGNSAFRDCMALTSINIPSNVTSIESYTFAGCMSLTSITIPESVKKLGDCAFDACPNLTSVTFQGTITSANFGSNYPTPFDGDLRTKYIASDGGQGTYTRFANGEKWTKK
jgi:hypothetical protein